MPSPKVCVLRAPGTNCDFETAYAFEQCGATAERVHLFRLLEQPRQLQDYQILCIPGGFSYGDDVGAGVIFGSQLRGHLAAALNEFQQADRLILGICNGFQVLMKAGILPGSNGEAHATGERSSDATLTWNNNGKYTARWVHLRTAGSHNVFLRGISELDLPIAHAEGRLVARDDSVIERWRKNGQVALCYSHGGPVVPAPEPAPHSPPPVLDPGNPNGSVADIAGLSDPTGRILGLMPHPERYIHRTQHPQWTRLQLPEEGAGLKLFRNAVEYFS
jgi:phosphoribosylformylglycinamidine synthase